MRRRLAAVLVFSAFIPIAAFAQAPQPQTCDEREILLREVVNQDSQMRRSVEIELAATKVQVKLLKEQIEKKAKEQVKEHK